MNIRRVTPANLPACLDLASGERPWATPAFTLTFTTRTP